VAARREVRDDAIVLVDSCELPDDRDLHVPYGFEAAISIEAGYARPSDVSTDPESWIWLI
jgi:hypothetical protein